MSAPPLAKFSDSFGVNRNYGHQSVEYSIYRRQYQLTCWVTQTCIRLHVPFGLSHAKYVNSTVDIQFNWSAKSWRYLVSKDYPSYVYAELKLARNKSFFAALAQKWDTLKCVAILLEGNRLLELFIVPNVPERKIKCNCRRFIQTFFFTPGVINR